MTKYGEQLLDSYRLAQYAVLRHHVCNAGAWVWANAVGWAAAMAVMFTGAGIPAVPWPWTISARCWASRR